MASLRDHIPPMEERGSAWILVRGMGTMGVGVRGVWLCSPSGCLMVGWVVVVLVDPMDHLTQNWG